MFGSMDRNQEYEKGMKQWDKYLDARKNHRGSSLTHEEKCLKHLKNAADAGHVEAIYKLATWHSHTVISGMHEYSSFSFPWGCEIQNIGNEIKVSDFERSVLENDVIPWLIKVAEYNHQEAIYALGVLCAGPKNTSFYDLNKAITYLEKVITLKDARERLAMIYKHRKEYAKAISLLQADALLQTKYANVIAECRELIKTEEEIKRLQTLLLSSQNQSVSSEFTEVFPLLKKVAESYKDNNNVPKEEWNMRHEVFVRLGDCYYYGHGTKGDLRQATECYKMAAQYSERLAILMPRVAELANGLSEQLKFSEAAPYLTKTIEQYGEQKLWAYRNLAYCYQYGEGVEKNKQKALELYQVLAAKGTSEDKCALGYFCEREMKNGTEAVRWYMEASKDPENSKALYYLAKLYQDGGAGIDVNLELALDYFEQAAKLGHEMAESYANVLRRQIEEERQEREEREAQQALEKANENMQASVENSIAENTVFASEAHEELYKLIGLASVKQAIAEIEYFIKSNQMRREAGLPVTNISKHMVFTGNPGTGKTSVARIVAKIFKENGVLSKGQLIETDREGLVGSYIGHTAPKTSEKVKEAIGGVLFIDEAYTLTRKDDDSDFGQEAVDTLLKLMEENREDLVVIVAGYEEEMKQFLSSNPGLRSRFTNYIDFPDYTTEEMQMIFDNMAIKNQFLITEEAREKLLQLWDDSHRYANVGNGRAVRNVYEKVQMKQATRIVKTNQSGFKALVTILPEDIPLADEVFH